MLPTGLLSWQIKWDNVWKLEANFETVMFIKWNFISFSWNICDSQCNIRITSFTICWKIKPDHMLHFSNYIQNLLSNGNGTQSLRSKCSKILIFQAKSMTENCWIDLHKPNNKIHVWVWGSLLNCLTISQSLKLLGQITNSCYSVSQELYDIVNFIVKN